MFKVEFTASALEDLDFFKPYEQNPILDAVEQQLPHEPLTPTRHRKELRPTPLATWELQVGKYRVFYDVEREDQVVRVKAVGWKEHNQLFIRGKEFTL
ncbi:MAG: type II toxin-antitoxin system RelE/ParE family toxin [Deltaproteobacteria bacterium]|nr:type II toxin-antitoxin system RelE/ParE family toxin [Deltaproteobacteria bacterium]